MTMSKTMMKAGLIAATAGAVTLSSQKAVIEVDSVSDNESVSQKSDITSKDSETSDHTSVKKATTQSKKGSSKVSEKKTYVIPGQTNQIFGQNFFGNGQNVQQWSQQSGHIYQSVNGQVVQNESWSTPVQFFQTADKAPKKVSKGDFVYQGGNFQTSPHIKYSQQFKPIYQQTVNVQAPFKTEKIVKESLPFVIRDTCANKFTMPEAAAYQVYQTKFAPVFGADYQKFVNICEQPSVKAQFKVIEPTVVKQKVQYTQVPVFEHKLRAYTVPQWTKWSNVINVAANDVVKNVVEEVKTDKVKIESLKKTADMVKIAPNSKYVTVVPQQCFTMCFNVNMPFMPSNCNPCFQTGIWKKMQQKELVIDEATFKKTGFYQNWVNAFNVRPTNPVTQTMQWLAEVKISEQHFEMNQQMLEQALEKKLITSEKFLKVQEQLDELMAQVILFQENQQGGVDQWNQGEGITFAEYLARIQIALIEVKDVMTQTWAQQYYNPTWAFVGLKQVNQPQVVVSQIEKPKKQTNVINVSGNPAGKIPSIRIPTVQVVNAPRPTQVQVVNAPQYHQQQVVYTVDTLRAHVRTAIAILEAVRITKAISTNMYTKYYHQIETVLQARNNDAILAGEAAIFADNEITTIIAHMHRNLANRGALIDAQMFANCQQRLNQCAQQMFGFLQTVQMVPATVTQTTFVHEFTEVIRQQRLMIVQ